MADSILCRNALIQTIRLTARQVKNVTVLSHWAQKLIQSLKTLRDVGNSVIVVEHDKDMIEQANHILDIGPYAGKNGGTIISQGGPKELLKAKTLVRGENK